MPGSLTLITDIQNQYESWEKKENPRAFSQRDCVLSPQTKY